MRQLKALLLNNVMQMQGPWGVAGRQLMFRGMQVGVRFGSGYRALQAGLSWARRLELLKRLLCQFLITGYRGQVMTVFGLEVLWQIVAKKAQAHSREKKSRGNSGSDNNGSSKPGDRPPVSQQHHFGQSG
jgi:hypothetical protein